MFQVLCCAILSFAVGIPLMLAETFTCTMLLSPRSDTACLVIPLLTSPPVVESPPPLHSKKINAVQTKVLKL